MRGISWAILPLLLCLALSPAHAADTKIQIAPGGASVSAQDNGTDPPTIQTVCVSGCGGGGGTTNQGTQNAGGTTSWWVRLTDNIGNAITSTLFGSKQALDVNIAGGSGINANGSATSANSAPVVIASDQPPVAVKPQGQTTGGDSTYDGPSGAVVTNTVVAAKASAGQIYAWALGGTGNAAACYLQVFDLATGSVTLGTTVPKLSIGIPAGGGSNLQLPNGIAFATAISVAATTTRSGSTACTVGIDTNLDIK